MRKLLFHFVDKERRFTIKCSTKALSHPYIFACKPLARSSNF